MIEGTPQDQCPTPPEPNSGPTAIPMQVADADQLPREQGWTYDEMAAIVGNLYLTSHHQMKVREDQFESVVQEHERHAMQLQGEIAQRDRELENLRQQVATLRRELEIRSRRDGRTNQRGSAEPDNGSDN